MDVEQAGIVSPYVQVHSLCIVCVCIEVWLPPQLFITLSYYVRSGYWMQSLSYGFTCIGFIGGCSQERATSRVGGWGQGPSWRPASASSCGGALGREVHHKVVLPFNKEWQSVIASEEWEHKTCFIMWLPFNQGRFSVRGSCEPKTADMQQGDGCTSLVNVLSSSLCIPRQSVRSPLWFVSQDWLTKFMTVPIAHGIWKAFAFFQGPVTWF